MQDLKHIGTPEYRKAQRRERIVENIAAGALAVLFTGGFYVLCVFAFGLAS